MSGPPVTIRGALPADIAAIAALQARSFPDPWDVASLARLATLPGAVLLVATDDIEGVCGYVLGQAVAEIAELTSIAVMPTRRQTGIGRHLLDAFEGVVAALGAERVVLDVAADNNPARRLYCGCGYAVVGERLGYYRQGRKESVDAVVMARPLGS